jgi:hypothetical protein
VGAVRATIDEPPADLESDVEEFVYALKERGLIDLVSVDA